MSRIPRRPSSTKPNMTSGDLIKSATESVFSPDTILVSEPVSKSSPDVLFDVPTSSAHPKQNIYYVIDFYPNMEWKNQAVVTRIAHRLLRYSSEELTKRFSADRLSKTELLHKMLGVKKINRDAQTETPFRLILTDAGSLLWKEIEPVDQLLSFEKLLYRSFDFRTAVLIMQDYCDKLNEQDALQIMMDELSEKLLSRDIVFQHQEEALFFFQSVHARKMLSVFQAFELFDVSITAELWQLLYALQNRASLFSDNLKTILSLSPGLYASVLSEIAKMPNDTSSILLSDILRQVEVKDRVMSPLVLSVSSPLPQRIAQSANLSGSAVARGQVNASSQFLTVRSMTLFSRSSAASPSRSSSKSPKTRSFSP